MATKKAAAPKGLAEAKARLQKSSVPSDTPTSASEWKRASTEGMLVRVPSGKTARIKTPGMDVFMREGVIPNSLLPTVKEMMSKGAKTTDSEVEELLDDPDMIEKIVTLADAVAVYCFLEPQVYPVPAKDEEGNEIEERDPELLYVDDVDFIDKMFVFAAATGGPSQLEKFRELTDFDVAVIPNS